MSDRHTVTARTMCFIFCGDEVLLIKASEKKDYPGVYDPLGGHVELGEDIIACANREIQEESGLDVTGTKLKGVIHVTKFFGKNLMMFVTVSHIPHKVIPPIHEEGIPEWIRLDQLDTIKLFDDLKPIIRTLANLKDTEIFTGTSRFDDSGQLVELNLQVS